MSDVNAILYSSSMREIYPPNTGTYGRPKFIVHSGRLAVLATAHSSTAGFYWIINPLANTKNLAVRRIVCRTTTVTALSCPTAPRITIERMTFTGTSSGAVLTPAKLETAESAATAIVTTEITGLTPVADGLVTGFIVPSIMTAVGAGTTVDQAFIPNISEEIILIPGEGLVIRQADNGTAADTRIAIVDIVWEEYTR